MGRSANTYWPASLALVVRTCPVSTWVAVIVTLGTTDPDGSVTVPTRVAVWADAARLKPSISRQRTSRERTRPFFAATTGLPARVDEKALIVSTPSQWQARHPSVT